MEYVGADLTKPETLPPLFEGGVDRVFHLGPTYPFAAVDGTVELREAGEAEASRADGAADSTVQTYVALVALAAAVLLALTAGAWYARRRWLG